ncbi:MAG: hypothetical protein NXH91_00320 [Phyllobacteriaceae bacterium]|nr:hypothetical protein [Phyllobacteriaceae bacterium]
MTRFVYATLVGLVGAAVVHLIIVFLLPLVSANTPWNRIAGLTETNAPYRLPASMAGATFGNGVHGPDPFFETIVCRYDLDNGAAHLRSTARVPLWTVNLYDSLGTGFFSANDRLAAGQRLDLAVLDASQLRFVRQSTPAELAGAIIAPADDPRGFAVVRVFVPDETWTGISARFADALECRSLEF